MTAAFCPHCGYNLTKDELIECGGFSLDPRGTVAFEGRQLALTRSEAIFLFNVAAGRGRPVPLHTIGDRMSEADDVASVVRQMAHRVRNKLRRSGIPCPVGVVHGSGYRWEARA